MRWLLLVLLAGCGHRSPNAGGDAVAAAAEAQNDARAPQPACEESHPSNACTAAGAAGYACQCFHANGRVSEAWHVVRQQRDGAYRRYHDNGQLASEELYRAGIREGRAADFHHDGRPRWVTHYRNGKRHGTSEVFPVEPGGMSRRAEYRDGLAVSETEFWGDGTVVREAVVDGDLVTWKRYFEGGGQLMREGAYVLDPERGAMMSDGDLHGALREYRPDGTLALEETYERGRLVRRTVHDPTHPR